MCWILLQYIPNLSYGSTYTNTHTHTHVYFSINQWICLQIAFIMSSQLVKFVSYYIIFFCINILKGYFYFCKVKIGRRIHEEKFNLLQREIRNIDMQGDREQTFCKVLEQKLLTKFKDKWYIPDFYTNAHVILSSLVKTDTYIKLKFLKKP